jgi:hypothetical protein
MSGDVKVQYSTVGLSEGPVIKESFGAVFDNLNKGQGRDI